MDSLPIFTSLFNDLNEDVNLNDQIYKNEVSIREKLKSKFTNLEKTLEVISASVKEAKKQKNKPEISVWNFAGYINTCSFDLAVAGESLLFEQNEWKKRYFSRMVAVTIYEASNDIPHMVGRSFREQVSVLPDANEFMLALGSSVKKINKFKTSHSCWLKDIRICCAAHRDQELDEQLRIIFEISPTKVIEIMSEFDSLLNELGAVVQTGFKLNYHK